jgi:hypothetical protein
MNKKMEIEEKFQGEVNPDNSPILGLDWNNTNDQIYMGTGSNMVKVWDLKSS